jgi:hypothetical protein
VARCAGTKRDGGRCTAIVKGSQTYCYQHDPERAGERRRAASKAGRSKPSRELASIKDQLAGMVDAVLSGNVPAGPYAVANQILNTRLRAIELERKIREQDELLERIEALEATAQGQPQTTGGYRWGS